MNPDPVLTRKDLYLNQSESRRRFVVSLGKAAIAASVVPSFFSVCAGTNANDTGDLSGTTITLDLMLAENDVLKNVGGAIKIPNPNDAARPMIVSRTSPTEAAAFSSRCTHMDCEVPLPNSDRITCPCHQSQFDGAGNLVSGTATRSLRKYTATLQGTTITINA